MCKFSCSCDHLPKIHTMRTQHFELEYPVLNDGYQFPPAKVQRHMSALEYLASTFSTSGSVQEWRARLDNGQLQLEDGQNVDSDTLLQPGDCLVYTRAPWREPTAPSHFDVLLEDDQVLAVAKPAGLQVLPKGDFCQRTLMWLLQQYHQQHRSRRYPDSLVPVPVHRLGRGTSGVLLCACTDAARKQLSKDFAAATDMGAAAVTAESGATACEEAAQRPLGKQYRALVTGVLEHDEGEVRVPIGPVDYPGLSSGLFAASDAGKPALSRYRLLTRHADSTLVEVTILTGRPHQIRIHMAALGHPLVDDPLYGPGGVPKVDVLTSGKAGAYADADCVMPGDCGYHLHSMQLQFRHPTTGDALTIQAPVPRMLQTPQEQDAAAA